MSSEIHCLNDQESTVSIRPACPWEVFQVILAQGSKPLRQASWSREWPASGCDNLEPTHTTLAFLVSKCYLWAIINIKWQGHSQAHLPVEWDVCCRAPISVAAHCWAGCNWEVGGCTASHRCCRAPTSREMAECNILRNLIGRQRWDNIIFTEGCVQWQVNRQWHKLLSSQHPQV